MLKTQMWVPHNFLLVKGTQNLIPGSWVMRNLLCEQLLGYVIKCIYLVA